MAGVVQNLKSASVRILILLLLIPSFVFAQVEDDEYKREVRKVRRELDKDADVQLPEEELVAVLPNMRSLSTGNWGYPFLGVNDDVIKDRATRRVNVVILDTGVPQHPYLRPFTDYNLSFSTTGESNVIDVQGHATHCGGIIAANHPTLKLGVATQLARQGLLKVIYGKVLRDNGSGTYQAIVAGVDKAVEVLKSQQGFGIISMSLGGGGDFPQLQQAIQRARDAGIYVVAAAGNSGREGVEIPAKYTIAVGAINEEGKRANFSTTGVEVFTAAPGVNILSTYRDTIAQLSGTSMATPMYAGMVAILASIYPNLTADSIAKMNIYTDIPPTGRDKETGAGYLHFNSIVQPAPAPPPVEPTPLPKRTVTVVLDGGDARWRIGTSPFQTLKVTKIEVQVTSNKTDVKLYDDLQQSTLAFFTRWSFVMPKDFGFIQAARSVGSFWNTLVGKENSAQLNYIEAEDESGRKTVIRFFPTASTKDIQFGVEQINVKPTLHERISRLSLRVHR